MESPAANGQAVCPQRRSVRKPLPARAPPLRPQPVPPAGKTPLDSPLAVRPRGRGPAAPGGGLRTPRRWRHLREPCVRQLLLRSAPWGWGSPREGARRWLSRPRPRPRPRPRAPLRAGEAWPRLPVSAWLAPRLWQQVRCFCEHPAEASGGSAGVPGPRACERKFRARALCAFEVPASPRNVSQSGCTSGRPPPRAPSADSISASSNPPWCPFGVRFFLW